MECRSHVTSSFILVPRWCRRHVNWRIRKIIQLLKLEANNLQRNNKTNGKGAFCEPNTQGCQYWIKGKFYVKEQLFIFFAKSSWILAFWSCHRVFHHTKHFMIDAVSPLTYFLMTISLKYWAGPQLTRTLVYSTETHKFSFWGSGATKCKL